MTKNEPRKPSEIHRLIDGMLKAFRRAEQHREVLTIGDLSPLATLTIKNDFHFLCINVGQSQSLRNEVFPSLSFACKDGQFHTFTNKQALTDYQSKHFATSAGTVLTYGTYRILQNLTFLTAQDETSMHQLLEVFFDNSSFHANLELDSQNFLRQRVIANLRKRKSALTLADLPRLISFLTRFPACLIHVSRSTFATIDESSCTSATRFTATELLFREKTKGQDTIRFKPHEPSTYTLWASAKFGKRLVGDNTDLSGRRYYCIYLPVLNTNDPGPREGNKSNKIILIFCRKRPTTSLLDLISFTLDAFSRLRYGEYRFTALQKARKTLLDLPRTEDPENELGHSTLLRSFKEMSTRFLADVVETTDAHSATVRLFDQHTRGLQLVAAAYGTQDSTVSATTVQSIAISDNKHTSVNAFTFLNTNRESLEYVYLPRLIAAKDGSHAVPDIYKHRGLARSLWCRTDTRSEICFPIKFGNIVVGTINIESALPFAFDNDIQYLKLFQHYLEEAYQKHFAQYDIHFFSEQMRIYAAVHELDQYIKLGFFDTRQERILRALFPFRAMKRPADDRLGLGTIKQAVADWIETTYRHLESEQRDIFRRILRVDYLDEDRLVGHHRDGLLSIIKNLMQNIIDHGDENSNVIIVDDRGLYEGTRGATIRVYCKMNAIRSEDTLDKICVVPIRDNAGDLRFGMFLVGAVARNLGGTVFVDRTSQGTSTTIVIQVPYPEVSP